MIAYIGSTTSIITSVMLANVDVNANKEIEKGNKIMASVYLAKSLGKAVSEKDKTKILNERTKTFDNYLAMATNYGAPDAAASAHATTVKYSNKLKMRIVLVHLLVNVILMVINGNIAAIAPILTITMVAGYYKKFEIASMMTSMIGVTLLTTKIMSLLGIILEYYGIRAKLTDYVKIMTETVLMLI